MAIPSVIPPLIPEPEFEDDLETRMRRKKEEREGPSLVTRCFGGPTTEARPNRVLTENDVTNDAISDEDEKDDPRGSIWSFETGEEEAAAQMLSEIAQEALGGDETRQELLVGLWDGESWESIAKKLQTEGSVYYVWWMDGVRAFLASQGQRDESLNEMDTGNFEFDFDFEVGEKRYNLMGTADYCTHAEEKPDRDYPGSPATIEVEDVTFTEVLDYDTEETLTGEEAAAFHDTLSEEDQLKLRVEIADDINDAEAKRMGHESVTEGTITWDTDVNAPGSPGQIVHNGTGKSILVQTDWDYPGVARTFGWDIRMVQQEEGGDCYHSGTDGTVDCPECGVRADEFMASAYDWLVNSDGETVDDPGYFEDSEDDSYPMPRDDAVRRPGESVEEASISAEQKAVADVHEIIASMADGYFVREGDAFEIITGTKWRERGEEFGNTALAVILTEGAFYEAVWGEIDFRDPWTFRNEFDEKMEQAGYWWEAAYKWALCVYLKGQD